MSTGNVASASVARGRADGLTRHRGSPPLTLLAVALGVVMVALDGTIVAVANPSIQRTLHASLAQIQWVSNGYMLALAIMLITVGKLGDHFGHRKIFLIGMVGFGITSGLIGLSGSTIKSIELVIAFRVVAGLFGAMIMPTALALMRETFPVEKLNTALGVWAAVIGASTAAGPIVGGLLVQHINWESCFYVNVLVAPFAIFATWAFVNETKPSAAARHFDLPGIGLLSLALFSLVWGLIKSSAHGWGSAYTLGFIAVAFVIAAIFVWWENRVDEPLIPMRLFRSVSLSVGVLLTVMQMFAMLGALFYITFFFQNMHGLSPVMSGVWSLPLTGALIVTSPLAGLLIQKIGAKWPLVIGLVIAAVGLYGLSTLSATSAVHDVAPWFVVLGIGLSPVMVGATDVVVANAPVELAGVAGGVSSTGMQVGGVLGTSVMGAVVASRVSTLLPAHWAAVHLPAMSAAQFAEAKAAVVLGAAPVGPHTPATAAALITQAAHLSFMGALKTAFLVAMGGMLVAAVLALFVRSVKHEDEAEMQAVLEHHRHEHGSRQHNTPEVPVALAVSAPSVDAEHGHDLRESSRPIGGVAADGQGDV